MTDLSIELEALAVTYDSDYLAIHDDHASGCTRVSFKVRPYDAGEDGSQQYVTATLQMEVGGTYPECPPQIKLSNAKGLSEVNISRIRSRLQEVAAEFLGDMMLMPLCSTAQEELTAMNQPEGTCSFCLESIEEDQSVFKTECWHIFHTTCFQRWWAWAQRYWECEERSLEERAGSVTAAARLKDGIPNKTVRATYSSHCPVCRSELSEEAVAQVIDDAFVHSAGCSIPDDALKTQPAQDQVVIDLQLAEQLRHVAHYHKRVLDKQTRCDGIIRAVDRSVSALQNMSMSRDEGPATKPAAGRVQKHGGVTGNGVCAARSHSGDQSCAALKSASRHGVRSQRGGRAGRHRHQRGRAPGGNRSHNVQDIV